MPGWTLSPKAPEDSVPLSQGTASLPSQGTASPPPQWTASPTSQGTVPPPPQYLPSLQRLLQNSILPELSLMLCMTASGKTVPSICAGAMQASSASCLWPCCLAGSMGNSPPGHTLMLSDHRPEERRQLWQCLRGGGGAEGWKTRGDVALMATGGGASPQIPSLPGPPTLGHFLLGGWRKLKVKVGSCRLI